MKDEDSLLEILVGLMILTLVGAQTWVTINDATGGEAGRTVQRWWLRTGRPVVVRAIMWLDAHALTERMVTEEIEPLLKGES